MAEEVFRASAADDLTGVVIDHCVIGVLLGQGGMARVYKARQEHLDRDVAIKILPPYYAADPAFVERFGREARAMAKLSHPNIVTVHNAGEEQGRLFIVMEYIGGGNLSARLRPTLPLPEAVRVVHDVASALSYAHARGIVHRDVKPGNVLVDTDGRIVLSDFGIAKVMASSNVVTRSGAGVGTPEYMSPEQCRGIEVDARSDIYALGTMLYEMLTGRTPFEADNYTAMAHAQIYEMPTPPSRLNPRISPAVQSVIMKALEKDPSERFQQATEMALALEQAAAAQMPVGPAAPRRTGNAPTHTGQQVAALVCPRCGSPALPGQQFCTSCGTSLRAGQGQPMQGYVPAPGLDLICPRCHAANSPSNRFCTHCGTPLAAPNPQQGRACRACGQLNAPDMRFCTRCGSPM